MCGGVAVTMWGQAALAAGAGVLLLGYWQLMLHLHASAGTIDSPNTAWLPGCLAVDFLCRHVVLS